MKMKEKSEKFGLRLNIPRTKIMTSNPINAQQRDAEKMEKARHYFGCSKITADFDMTKVDNIFKSRDIVLPTNFHIVKGMGFLTVMYG